MDKIVKKRKVILGSQTKSYVGRKTIWTGRSGIIPVYACRFISIININSGLFHTQNVLWTKVMFTIVLRERK